MADTTSKDDIGKQIDGLVLRDKLRDLYDMAHSIEFDGWERAIKQYGIQEQIDGEKRGVAWTIGIVDEMHELDIAKNGGVRDSQYKGIKNGIRAMYEQDTGNGDPAPGYPINVKLTALKDKEKTS